MREAANDAEKERIAALERYRLLDTAPDERLDRITLLVKQIFRVPTAIVTLVDEHRQWFKSRVGLLVQETARDIAFCNLTIRGDRVMVVRDAARDRTFAGNPLVFGELGLRFYAGAPLRTPDGYNIGTLAVIDYEPRDFSGEEERILQELAQFVMSEFELWRRLRALDEEHEGELAAQAERYEKERVLVERRFRALVEHAPEVTLLFDENGRIHYANPSSESVLGSPPQDLYGADLVERLIGEQDRDEARAWLAAMAQGELRSRDWTFCHRDGSEVHVLATVQNLSADPAVGGLVLHAREVSAEVRARAELERTRKQLKRAERLEAVGRLAGGVAHDFNNLLTVIFNSADFAMRKLPAGSAARRELDQIIEAAERGASLTRHILTFSRECPASFERVHPNALVGHVLELLDRVIGEGIELVVSLGEQLPALMLDRAQIEQVLINLCVNARDAMDGSGKIFLQTELAQLGPEVTERHPWAAPGAYVALSVRDTGAGMPPYVVEHAFEPFFTTKAAGKGTGLGLATAYGSVRQHGGFIDIRSTPGEGTELSVYLPSALARTAQREAPSSTALPQQVQGHGAILLAEDDDAVRQLAGRALEAAGYRVYTARDGLEAVDLYRSHSSEIRIAVLDAIMPRLSGMEAAKRMRELCPSLEFLVVSGYEQGKIPEGRWLTKPYAPEHLVARVQAVLGD